jgi:hypothetical protein
MRNTIFSFWVLCLLSSCVSTSYVQLYKTEAPGLKTDGSAYLYDNDTLAITYVLWADSGVMSYKLYNKTDKPLYIDWHKSNMVLNGHKLDYYQDETVSKSTTDYSYSNTPAIFQILSAFGHHSCGGYYYNEMIGSTTQGNAIRKERVTFIPPRSYIYRSEYTIARSLFKDWGTDYQAPMAQSYTRKNKKTKVFVKDFDMQHSPIVVRNYLTASFDESGVQNFTVDNTFYVSQIQAIKEDDILSGYNFETKKYSKILFEKGTWFYRAPHLATSAHP